MRDPIRVLILGTGQMGAGIARLVIEKRGLDLVGAYGRRADRAGADVGPVIGLKRNLGITIGNDLATVIQGCWPHVAIQATCSKLEDAWAELSVCLRHGVSVVSIAEEMAYPACRAPALTEEMHRLAQANGAAVLGTGINPGFVLDLLVIALTGVCSHVESITATRVNDLSPYGPSVLAAQGVGLRPEAFEAGVKDGSVTGHVGFCQSINMIAAALGWEVERIEEIREPIVSRVRRVSPSVTVEPGYVAGCKHTATAYCRSKAVITMIHPQQILPHIEGVATGDAIEIVGTPKVSLSGSPEIPGGEATMAIAVNMIPRVLNAAPGLYTMADLPVPAAMLGDARRFVRVSSGRPAHG
jgi:4-hydroxy-tetrahydrodipicolinate reductase